MVDHTHAEIRANGAGMQLYLSKEFAIDSQFPFDGGEEVLVHRTPGGGIIALPVENLSDAYPLAIDEPPPGVDDSLYRAQAQTQTDNTRSESPTETEVSEGGIGD